MADQLTDEQIAEFKEAFSLFDKDGDGTLLPLLSAPLPGLARWLDRTPCRSIRPNFRVSLVWACAHVSPVNFEGQIAKDDLVTALRSLGLNVDEAEAQRLLGDAASGGAIEFPAFLSVAARKMASDGKQTAERLAECFDVFDDGRSGSIPAEQLRQVMTSHGDRLTEEEADAMVREADPRGEGRVEYKEYVKVLTKNK
ncbi:hypothetical protein PR202_ga05519 [Eleusine coracana subsp. coracana]|uniref:EF-hand domain-containing protein n=1 Tax=Eleusine coracana subsp. coracana TaxID=191504 RepID=A0AAV5BR69_ELECO|nr:hypothetical protein PR202_ga05066 [Eleusine coracana subsp. coracana]GJM89337.1 hypothetical protein PR202_ga05519 [Eleusine coracana subsp. coracana]